MPNQGSAGAAFAVALLPVLWIGLTPMSSAGGRILYLPGVFFALLLGAGTDAVLSAKLAGAKTRHAVAVAAVAVTLAHYVKSTQDQAAVWARACALSRDAITQFQPFVGRQGSLHIANLPFSFLEGPYVLKSYAFRFYYAPRPVPQVMATAETLTVTNGVVSVVSREPEPGAPPAPDTPPSLGTLTFARRVE